MIKKYRLKTTNQLNQNQSIPPSRPHQSEEELADSVASPSQRIIACTGTKRPVASTRQNELKRRQSQGATVATRKERKWQRKRRNQPKSQSSFILMIRLKTFQLSPVAQAPPEITRQENNPEVKEASQVEASQESARNSFYRKQVSPEIKKKVRKLQLPLQ
ncbi:hypothetical protein BLNAU_4282 [Blattamonas nauphoetae]|uniref:Uncharacterized protein n=1 Tax=Blattamonas nauphoetae TaxID=2049346 RepID=A0ABQ9YAY2_9EUKA|nr:hypothetical protein BLNAU_4282 [Blattamonas nauphoetae]